MGVAGGVWFGGVGYGMRVFVWDVPGWCGFGGGGWGMSGLVGYGAAGCVLGRVVVV